MCLLFVVQFLSLEANFCVELRQRGIICKHDIARPVTFGGSGARSIVERHSTSPTQFMNGTSTTRSGKTYGTTMHAEGDSQEHGREAPQTGAGAVGDDGPRADGAATTELTRMMQIFLEDRQRLEAELAEERRRRDRDMEDRVLQMQEEMRELRAGISAEGSTVRPPATARTEGPKLTKVTEADDIEAYLTTFERLMRAYEVSEDRWALKLAPQLTGKAQHAYAAMDTSQSADYTALKAAILRRYDINDETYRQRFRSARRREGETQSELVIRLTDVAQKWTKECATVEKLLDVVVLEQFLDTLDPNTRIWVKERKPKSSEEAGRLADDYAQARKQADSEPGGTIQAGVGSRKCHNCGIPGHFARECSKQPRSSRYERRGDSKHEWRQEPRSETIGDQKRSDLASEQRTEVRDEQRRSQPTSEQKHEPRGIHDAAREPRRGPIKCYNCGQMGHVSRRCPSNAALLCQETRRPCGEHSRADGRVSREGWVEAHQVADILLDTGCSRTLVRSDLVPADKLLEGEAVTIRCAHGDTVLYPLAEVSIQVGGVPLLVEAAVSETLPVSVLLGTDVPELGDLLGKVEITSGHTQGADAMVVTTRARAKQQEHDEDVQLQRQNESGVRASPVTEGDQASELCHAPDTAVSAQTSADEETVGPIVGAEFSEDLFNTGRARVKLSRSEKRAARRQYAGVRGEADSPETVPLHTLDMPAEEVRKLQWADKTLEAARRAADGETSTAGVGFFWSGGLLHRRWQPPGRGLEMAVEQLVLPLECRPTVLHLAHTVPLAGHLGRDKTARRILQRFYWPTLYKDVADYCRHCAECQKAGSRGIRHAPMIPLPIVGEPFQKIAMDIVGPLPRSRAGHRYVLVICDYATRYPEAVAMKSIDAEQVAEELVKVFSRMGIPKEILTDQGSNFTSRLLREIYNLLHIHPIRTTPYHPQTDGLVERFNKTLKSLLRKTASDSGKDWDRLLPFLLFAYREVPQASTGFSPFELLFGREVRGPLDILKESWVANHRSSESVVSHVLAMRDRMESMTGLVQEHLKDAQARQKRWYDRRARDRVFQPGDQVLVLLPTSSSKLLARWHGPYKVIRKEGKVTYLIDLHDTRKRKRVLHVNMLREWHAPVATCLFAEETPADDEDFPEWRAGEVEQPTMGEHLDTQEREDLAALFAEFTDVLQSKPGRTSMAYHRIPCAADAKPVRLPPYRIPHAYRDSIQRELQEMQTAGIIEPSRSEWASPIVIVKKKDGGIRLCVDYRRLNSVTPVDAYPMPRIDEIIDKLGQAKYITTIDLARGYWQVPVAEEDTAKTAFSTPWGLYQFRMMPFGLSGAPATFQRLMDDLLRGTDDFAAAYMDDLVIYSGTWEEHCDHIRQVMQRLREHGLTAKPKKCQFGMRFCVYLGHIVGGGQVRPEVSKLQAVEGFPVPTTKKAVRAFLGLTGYYRRFIPDFASVAAPLTDLTRKNVPNHVPWNSTCNRAFQELKRRLCNAPVLQSPDFTQPFVIQTDASDYGVGAVLSQRDSDGCDHPVAYFSKKLLPREQNYSTVEKECLAIRLGVQAFRVYLLGRSFTVQTDHRALLWLDRLKESNARLTRWSLALQQYSFRVEHRAGRLHANADALSRLV